jgi:3-oxoacyl-[acyl-carrier-protein] synthase-3
MASLKIENIRICGISACVPKKIDENAVSPLFGDKVAFSNFVSTTGVERTRKASSNICTSDLCVFAAEKMISDLNWKKEDISILVFVSQTSDYILPATSCIIQDRLGLNKECYTLDISLGCSGWVYGMSVVAGLLQSIMHKTENRTRALLLAGDTPSKAISMEDKSAWPLFGDAGTATALEYIPNTEPMLFSMNSDGSGFEAIMINDGGYRNPVSLSSFDKVVRGEGIISNNTQLILDGMDVFSFGIKRAPKSVSKLIEEFDLDKEQIDYFIFHQANLFMNEQIRKKLNLSSEKVPYSLKNFGNTSSASIPLTMITQLRNELTNKKLNHIACGFGVGLSWGSMYFTTDHICCPLLVEV